MKRIILTTEYDIKKLIQESKEGVIKGKTRVFDVSGKSFYIENGKISEK